MKKKKPLTARQKTILRLAARHTNKRIASFFGCHPQTIQRELTIVYKFLDLNHISRAPGARRTVALVTAVSRGIIDIDDVASRDRPVIKD